MPESKLRDPSNGYLYLLLQSLPFLPNNSRNFILERRPTSLPTQVLPRPLRTRPHIQPPTHSLKTCQLTRSVNIQRLYLSRWDKSFIYSDFSNQPGYISPTVLAIRGYIVCFASPEFIVFVAAVGALEEEDEQTGHVSNMDIAAD